MADHRQEFWRLLNQLLDSYLSSKDQRIQKEEFLKEIHNKQATLDETNKADARHFFIANPEHALLLTASASISAGRGDIDLSYIDETTMNAVREMYGDDRADKIQKTLDSIRKHEFEREQEENMLLSEKKRKNSPEYIAGRTKINQDFMRKSVDSMMANLYPDTFYRTKRGLSDKRVEGMKQTYKEHPITEDQCIEIWYHNFNKGIVDDGHVINDPAKMQNASDLETCMREYIVPSAEQQNLMNMKVKVNNQEKSVKDCHLSLLNSQYPDIYKKLSTMQKLDITAASHEASIEATLNDIYRNSNGLLGKLRKYGKHISDEVFQTGLPFYKRKPEIPVAETLSEGLGYYLSHHNRKLTEHAYGDYKEYKSSYELETKACETIISQFDKQSKKLAEKYSSETNRTVDAVKDAKLLEAAEAMGFARHFALGMQCNQLMGIVETQLSEEYCKAITPMQRELLESKGYKDIEGMMFGEADLILAGADSKFTILKDFDEDKKRAILEKSDIAEILKQRMGEDVFNAKVPPSFLPYIDKWSHRELDQNPYLYDGKTFGEVFTDVYCRANKTALKEVTNEQKALANANKVNLSPDDVRYTASLKIAEAGGADSQWWKEFVPTEELKKGTMNPVPEAVMEEVKVELGFVDNHLTDEKKAVMNIYTKKGVEVVDAEDYLSTVHAMENSYLNSDLINQKFSGETVKELGTTQSNITDQSIKNGCALMALHQVGALNMADIDQPIADFVANNTPGYIEQAFDAQDFATALKPVLMLESARAFAQKTGNVDATKEPILDENTNPFVKSVFLIEEKAKLLAQNPELFEEYKRKFYSLRDNAVDAIEKENITIEYTITRSLMGGEENARKIDRFVSTLPAETREKIEEYTQAVKEVVVHTPVQQEQAKSHDEPELTHELKI